MIRLNNKTRALLATATMAYEIAEDNKEMSKMDLRDIWLSDNHPRITPPRTCMYRSTNINLKGKPSLNVGKTEVRY